MSTSEESLSSILAGPSTGAPAEPVTDVKTEPAKAEPAAAPSAAKTEPTETPKADVARNDKGQFAPKTETTEAKPEKTAKPEPMVPLSALLAERAKRREPEAPKPKTSVLENEDQAFNERIAEHVNPLKETVFSISMDYARLKFDDFDDVAQVFAKAAENDQRLWQSMRESANPAMYIYQVGKQFKELAPFGGDVVRYKDHATASLKDELSKTLELNKALSAELETLKKSKVELDSVPRSLNSTASGASPSLGEADAEDLRKIVRLGNKT